MLFTPAMCQFNTEHYAAQVIHLDAIPLDCSAGSESVRKHRIYPVDAVAHALHLTELGYEDVHHSRSEVIAYAEESNAASFERRVYPCWLRSVVPWSQIVYLLR